MNDDLVQPDRGFGMHPHHDAEICTYVVRGALSHKDSQGNEETLGPGSIQFMTAGSGVLHSEHNHAEAQDLRFIQMWLTPRNRGLPPNYGSFSGGNSMLDSWSHLVSDIAGDADTPVKINTDANIFVAEVTAGRGIPLQINAGRQAYMLCVEGSAKVGLLGEEVHLHQHDACEVHRMGDLTVVAGVHGVHILVVEMAQVAGSGQADL